MQRLRYHLLPSLLAGVLCWPAAQATDLLTLYRAAINDNPALKARRLGIDRARADAAVAESRLYPQISVQTSASRNDYQDTLSEAHYNGRRTIWSARQAILDMPSVYRSDSARTIIRQTEKEADQARTELFAQLVDQYLNVLQADDELMQLQSEKEAAQKQVDRLQAMRQREMAKVTDLVEAISWLKQLSTREIDAANKGESARARLRELSGRDPGALALLVRAEFPAVPESVDYWIRAAQSANPGIIARRNALEASKLAADAARAEHWPQLSLSLQRNQSNQDIDNSPRREFTVDSVALELRIPIYEGGRASAGESSARAQQAIAREQLDSLLREVERDTRVIYAAALADRARIDSTNAEVEALTQTVRAQDRGYELGVATVINVLDARRRLLRSRVDQSKARYDYLRDLIGLKMRAGMLAEADVAEFNRWLGPRDE